MAAPRLSSRDLLERLVAFDTTSSLSNLGFIDFVQDYLEAHGARTTRIDYEPGVKANLHAIVGPEADGGVLLSGHSDVVPVTGQAWSSDPFTLTERDGRLYGRGTCDMKGFLAVALAAVPEFASLDLARPIQLAISCDEEVSCDGVRPLIAEIGVSLPRPAAVIVGEPTLMEVVNAHKATVSYLTEVTGLEAHSSRTHEGVSAILYAGEMLAELARIEAELRRQGDPSGLFDPGYTSLHVGTIHGGTAVNIIPGACVFDWEMRLLPGADEAAILTRVERFAATLSERMQAVSPAAGIATRTYCRVPGLRPEPGGAAETLAMALAGRNGAGTVSYVSEAGIFQEAGLSTVLCGPGSVDQAHKADEFIALAELERCDGFMRRLAAYCRR